MVSDHDGVGGTVYVCRTLPFGTGVRSVWYLPDGSALHAIENRPIPPGSYFLTPDDTGRHRNWVIERAYGSRCAAPAVLDCFGDVAVDARTDIEPHVGNRLEDSLGCPLLGLWTSPDGVEFSRKAIAHARRVLRRDEPDPPVWNLEVSG